MQLDLLSLVDTVSNLPVPVLSTPRPSQDSATATWCTDFARPQYSLASPILVFLAFDFRFAHPSSCVVLCLSLSHDVSLLPVLTESVSSLSSTHLYRALSLSLSQSYAQESQVDICMPGQLWYATPTHKPSKFMSVCLCVCVCVDDSGRKSDFPIFSITIKSSQNDNFHLM